MNRQFLNSKAVCKYEMLILMGGTQNQTKK